MKCLICFASFTDVIKYHTHLSKHTKQKKSKFKCYLEGCNKIFLNFPCYKIHVHRVHKKNRQPSIQSQCFKFVCSICKEEKEDQREFNTHIRYHFSRKEVLSCPYPNCQVEFKNFNSLISHSKRKHKNAHSNMNLQVESLPNNILNDNNNITEQNIALQDNFENVNHVSNHDSELVPSNMNSLSMLTFKMKYNHKVAEPGIQCVVDFFQQYQCNLKDKLNNILTDFDNKSVISGNASKIICEQINELLKVDSSMNTAYKREQIYTQCFDYITPQQIFLGIDENHDECFYHYVPIIESISVLLNKMPGLLNIHCQRNVNINSQYYNDIFDGKSYRNNSFFASEKRIEIILYIDSFGLTNPIGSAKNKHKIFAIYFTLGNLPRFIRLKIENIKLVLLCHESNIKKFTLATVLEHFIRDLKIVEDIGIIIKNNSAERILGSVERICGDNLGQHQVGGFNENFSKSEFFCRTCYITQNQFAESHKIRAQSRNPENYNDEVKKLSENIKSSGGVKFDSPFNKLSHFHVSQSGLPPCSAHDLFEGIVAVDLNLYIQSFVKRKWFSFYSLNLKFKIIQKKLKLSITYPIMSVKCKKLPGHANQNFTLLVLLPLIVQSLPMSSDTINLNDRTWQQVVRLLEICRISSSHKVLFNDLTTLTVLIDEYLDERVALYPEKNLLRKHHFITHYPEHIREFGPLPGCSTLRFESKHQIFKNIIRTTRNFVNVTHTLSNYHQKHQSSIMNELSNIQSIVAEHISKIDPDTQINVLNMKCELRAKKIIYQEITFNEGDYLVIKHNSEGQIIVLKIISIFYNDCPETIIFYGQLFVMEYQYLQGSYVLDETEYSEYVNFEKLLVPFPFTVCCIKEELRTSLKFYVPYEL